MPSTTSRSGTAPTASCTCPAVSLSPLMCPLTSTVSWPVTTAMIPLASARTPSSWPSTARTSSSTLAGPCLPPLAASCPRLLTPSVTAPRSPAPCGGRPARPCLTVASSSTTVLRCPCPCSSWWASRLSSWASLRATAPTTRVPAASASPSLRSRTSTSCTPVATSTPSALPTTPMRSLSSALRRSRTAVSPCLPSSASSCSTRSPPAPPSTSGRRTLATPGAAPCSPRPLTSSCGTGATPPPRSPGWLPSPPARASLRFAFLH
mmetsp:Transcript_18223/g.39850  ORF Transcript_18223/g.39850 Transcript_18223/m.39850 type:complete len:264 (+) Transcript_18223:281-1072(+)